MLEKPHKKLDVWKKSLDLIEEIYRLAGTFPKMEDFGLSSQMRRAAVSVAANIAEGAARQTRKEFVQYLHMSQASLSELDTHLEISKRLGYMDSGNEESLISLASQIDKMITGLIKSLRYKSVDKRETG